MYVILSYIYIPLVNVLKFIQEIAVTEILCRSAKHVFRTYLQSVPIHLLSFSTSHFLNCFLTIISSPASDYVFDEFSTSTSASTNNPSNSSLSNSTNTSSQKPNNKKKNKKQQQRKHSPTMRNGKSLKTKKK